MNLYDMMDIDVMYRAGKTTALRWMSEISSKMCTEAQNAPHRSSQQPTHNQLLLIDISSLPFVLQHRNMAVAKRKHLDASRDAQRRRRHRPGRNVSSGLLEFLSTAIDQTRGQLKAANSPATVPPQEWEPPRDVRSRSNMPCGCSTFPRTLGGLNQNRASPPQLNRGNQAELQPSRTTLCRLELLRSWSIRLDRHRGKDGMGGIEVVRSTMVGRLALAGRTRQGMGYRFVKRVSLAV